MPRITLIYGLELTSEDCQHVYELLGIDTLLDRIASMTRTEYQAYIEEFSPTSTHAIRKFQDHSPIMRVGFYHYLHATYHPDAFEPTDTRSMLRDVFCNRAMIPELGNYALMASSHGDFWFYARCTEVDTLTHKHIKVEELSEKEKQDFATAVSECDFDGQVGWFMMETLKPKINVPHPRM